MRELRLLPAALCTWFLVAWLIIQGSWWVPLLLLAGVILVALALGQPGQALSIPAVAVAAGLLAAERIRQAQAAVIGHRVTGRVESLRPVGEDNHLIQLRIPGQPVPLPVFHSGDAAPEPGQLITAVGTTSPNDRAGITAVVFNAGSVTVEEAATGHTAWVNSLREGFSGSVSRWVGESSQGLIPGMVLGDTRMQDELEQQLYIDTGLSHLSAVSGSNVSIVVTSVVVLCTALTLGPRIQVAGAVVALLLFVSVVGTEPSVLRAAVTGLVGLAAVLNSARMEPMHGLCLAVIALLFWDSDLAVHFGFILSVAATAGIVALHPLLYRGLARTGMMDVLVRALAVAIAADLVTIPVIMLMSGRVSLVAVLANVAVAAAVPPVTLIGLIAVLLSLLPGSPEAVALVLIEPCTWWIHQVASWCQALPNATLETGAGVLALTWALTCCTWVVVALHHGAFRVLATGLVLVVLFGGQTQRLPPVVDPAGLRHVVVDSEAGVHRVPAGTELIIVTDPRGAPAQRPTVTSSGIPVLFPFRDGEVHLHVDGSQHAVDGRF